MISAAVAMLLLAGCQRESLAPESGAQYDGKVNFAPCVAGIGSANDGGVRSGLSDGSASVGSRSLTLRSADGRFTIPMELSVTGAEAGIRTRASLINGDGNISAAELAAAISDTFMVAAWNDAATPEQIIPDQVMDGYTTADGKYQKVMYRTNDVAGNELAAPYWMTMQPMPTSITVVSTDQPADDEYIWKKNETKTFYAYANVPAGFTMALLEEGAGQTMTCPGIPTQDVLMGYYTGSGKNTGTASIQFYHPLTAVRFKKGEVSEGFTINSVSVENVYGSGVVKQVDETFTWTKDGTADFTAADATATASGDWSTGDDDVTALLLIPQTFGADSKTRICVSITTDDGDMNVYYPLRNTAWERDTVYTYTIGYNPPSEDPNLLLGRFSVSPTQFVQFTRGNLWYNTSGDSWNLENSQTDFASEVNADHISHFYNCKGGNYGSAPKYNNVWNINEDVDWGVPYNAQHGTSLTTLSTLDLDYILKQRIVNGGTGIGNTCQFVTVNGTDGLVIYPDDYSGTFFTSEQEITGIPEDCAFLPVAGKRGENTIEETGNGKIRYWLSTSYSGEGSYHLLAQATTTCKADQVSVKSTAFPVRLVQKGNWPEVTPTFVDLGLPSGTLWADVNVGATAASGQRSYGKYYAWGETAAYLEPMTDYGSWDGAKNAKYVEGVIKQHVNNEYWKWKLPSGSKYNSKDLLLPEDDIATIKYGEGYHIPTMAQWRELFNYCTWTWDAVNNGHIVSSIAYPDSSIFISQAGYYKEPSTLDATQALFWSSDYWDKNSQNCAYINPNNGVKNGSGLSNYGYALTVRAVKDSSDPEIRLLPGKFTINESGDQVQFASGNIYCKRSVTDDDYTYKFYAERTQYEFRTRPGFGSMINGTRSDNGTPANTSGHFQWNPSKSGSDYGAFGTTQIENVSEIVSTDIIEWGNMIGSPWSSLTKDEWIYINEHTTSMHSSITIGSATIKGDVFKPNNFTVNLKSSYTYSEWLTAEQNGVLFLPMAGYYTVGYDVSNIQNFGEYFNKDAGYSENRSSEEISTSYKAGVGSLGVNVAASIRLVQRVSAN